MLTTSLFIEVPVQNQEIYAVMYMCARSIYFAFFYEFCIEFWISSDSVALFAVHFIINLYVCLEHNMLYAMLRSCAWHCHGN